MAWQDAVAVVHEIAMLNDVTAVMNNRPPLVGPDTCFITRTGEVELPETADTESPEAVADLLRLLLSGREAPTALEDLAFGRHSRDLTTDLAAFSVGNRRAVIARLATRALAVAEGGKTAAATAPDEGPTEGDGDDLDAAFDRPPDTPTQEPARPVLVKSGLARLPVEASTPGPAVVLPPPFLASPRPPAAPSVPAAPLVETATRDERKPAPEGRWTTGRTAVPPPAPPAVATPQDLELRRLRQRQNDRARARQRWSPRWTLLARRVSRWVFWRPATPNPLVIGASVILVAAMASVLWRRAPTKPGLAAVAQAPKGPAAVAAPAVPPGSAPAASPSMPESNAPTSPPPAARPEVPTSLRAASPRAASPIGNSPPTHSPAAAPTSPVLTPAGSAVTSPPAAAGARSRPTLIVRRSTPVPDVPAAAGGRLDGDTAATRVPAPTPASGERVPAAIPPAPAPPATGRTAAGSSPSAIPARPARLAATLYSANDGDVDPPVMRRQHLPSSVLEPSAEAPDDWPFLEILIDASGAVEQVRLHARQLAPGQTLYRHRMLLAAAKAWQFEPARRNGEPVRYVMRVPLEP